MKWMIVSVWVGTMATCIAALSMDQEEKIGKRESLRVAVQKICPVSGRELPRDTPLKEWTDPASKERLYVCCEKCVTGSPDAKHLEKIRARQAEAQAECLIMDNPITAQSKSQIIAGYRIYVCCPPCFKKVEKSLDKSLAKLDALHEKYLNKE